MSLGRRFVGRRGWCIRVWRAGSYAAPEHEWTHLNPGPIKGDLVLEHNSIGACIAGQITMNGFCAWEPRSRLIEIFNGPEPLLSERLGMGIVGIVRGQKTVGGGRTATVPLLGLHTRDENGLTDFGFSQVGPFVSPEIYIVGSYQNTNQMPRRFGLTIDAAMKELFGDRVDSSWGVRPDGRRMAGYPGAAGYISVYRKDTRGTDYLALLRRVTAKGRPARGLAHPLNTRQTYKLTQWLKQNRGPKAVRLPVSRRFGNNTTSVDVVFAWANQGKTVWLPAQLVLDEMTLDANAINITYEDSGFEEPSFITEAEWRMSDRYSTRSSVRSDNGLVPRRGSSAETGTGDLVPTTSPLTAKPADQQGNMIGYTGGVDLVSLVNGAIKNPKAFDAMYDTLGVSIEVTVTAKFSDDINDVDIYLLPPNDIPGNTAVMLGPNVFVTEEDGTEHKQEPPFVYLEWAEWLADKPAAPKVQDRTNELPTIQVTTPVQSDWKKVATSTPIKNSDGFVTGLNETVIKPKITLRAKPEPFTDQETVIDDAGAIRSMYHQYATLTRDRPKFVWRFEAPAALLQMVDGAAPTVPYKKEVEVTKYENGVPVVTKEVRDFVAAAYQWCFGVAATANRKSTTLEFSATPVMHYYNAVHEPGMPDSPGFNLPFCSPPTFTGKINGELVYGPAIMSNLQSAAGGIYSQALTNTRMVISKDSYHTEFQTAAAQRTSNGTAQNMTNPQSFGSLGGRL